MCSSCGLLLDWFRSHFLDQTGATTAGWVTADATFRELAIQALDYVQWIAKAESEFGVIISDEEASELYTVGDYLGCIRRHSQPKDRLASGRVDDPLWDSALDA